MATVRFVFIDTLGSTQHVFDLFYVDTASYQFSGLDAKLHAV